MTEGSGAEVLNDPAYPSLKEFIIDTTGLAYYEHRDESLARKVASRLSESRLRNCAEYHRLLTTPSSAELDILVSHLTVGETYFFRNRPHFEALEQRIVPELLTRNFGTRLLDIWSAGCASGPEPYSLSMLFRERMAARTAGWKIRILASDINPEFLRQAEEARYSQWAFRAIPEELLRTCFRREGNRWRLNSRFQSDVRFLKHNLVVDNFPPLPSVPQFDLIVCRNVLIYFRVGIIRELVSKFHACLKPGGWLLVGHAEPSIELFAEFETVRTGNSILYRKSAAESLAPEPVEPPPPLPAPPRPPLSGPVVRNEVKPPSEKETLRRLTDQGRWEEARALCEQSLKTDPLRPDLHFFLALIHHNLGNSQARDDCLKRSLYLDRGFIQAHYYRGVFECERGRSQEAGRSFRAVLRLLNKDQSPSRSDESLDVLAPGQLRRMSLYYLRRMGEQSE